jgi:hypothetical protein
MIPSRGSLPGLPLRRIAGAFLLVCLCFTSALADSLDSWFRRSSPPTGFGLKGVTYGNGLFVAAGINSVVTSPDGTNWAWAELNYANYNIDFGAGNFVIVGAAERILSSPDGTNWTSRSTGVGALFDVTYGSGKWVAVGDHIKTSPDSVTWSSAPTPDRLTGIVYGNDRFVAIGFEGMILTSTDGVAWSQVYSQTALYLYSVAYGNGYFVAVGFDYRQAGYPPFAVYSSDGLNWQPAGAIPNGSGAAVTYGQGRFLSCGYGGTVVSSSHGDSWGTDSPPLPMGVEGMHFADGLFCAVGSAGGIAVSPSGTNWNFFNFSAAPTLQAVAFGKNGWVAAGDAGSMAGSDNGTNWFPLSSGTTDALYGVACSPNLFAGVGANGRILVSTDRTNWATQSSTTIQTLYGVAFAENQFIAVGTGGSLLTSPDGTNWDSRVSNTSQRLTAVARGGGLTIAVGYGGTTVSSSDGINWPAVTTPALMDLEGIAYGAGRFVAVGGSGRGPATIGTTTNGASWTTVGQDQNNSPTRWLGVFYANGVFTAVGNTVVATSTDGITWQKRQTGIHASLQAVGSGRNQFVAVGSAGQIYQSAAVGPRLLLESTGSPGPNLKVFGHANADFQIQSSTDLAHWTILQSGFQTDADFQWQDPEGFNSRFYRLWYP